jgi:DNA-binding response OmpR family regulator
MSDPRAARVLIIEDDEAVALLVRTLLSKAGYQVEWAATGQTSLDRLEAAEIDLVLLDLMLPDMSGLDVCRHVRERVGEVYLPVLMLTALASDAERLAGFAAGADDYITKPFYPDELLSRVRVWSRTRERLMANHRQLAAQTQALHEAERRALAAQLEAIRLAARELADLVNNRIATAKGTLELLQGEAELSPPLERMAEQAQQRLAEAAEFIQQLARVVRLKVKDTPTGPALDLAGSARARRRGSLAAARAAAKHAPGDPARAGHRARG